MITKLIIIAACMRVQQALIADKILVPKSLNGCSLKLCNSKLTGTGLLVVSVSDWKPEELHHDENKPVGNDSAHGKENEYQSTYHNLISQFMMMLNKESSWSVMIPGPRITKNIFSVEGINAYLIILEVCEDQCVLENLKKHLKTVSDDESWNPSARFIVVAVTGENHVRSSEISLTNVLVRPILEQLWRTHIYDSVVILSVTKHVVKDRLPITHEEYYPKTFVGAYSWFPYKSKGNCSRHVEDIVLLNSCIEDRNVYHYKTTDLYSPEPPKTLHDCPLTVTTFQYEPYVFSYKIDPNTTHGIVYEEGLEIRLIRLIADILRFKIVYTKPPPALWGKKYPNGTYTGLLGVLKYQKADIVFGACPLQSSKNNEIYESTTSYFIDAKVWFVPCARPIPRWRSLSRIFNSTLWLSVGFSCILSPGLFWFFANQSEYSLSGSLGSVDAFEMTWATLLEVPYSDKLYSTAYRVFFLHWLFYCLIINNAYRSFLISVLANPGKQHQLNTLEDILDSGINIGYSSFLNSFFKDTNDWRHVELIKRRIDSDDLSNYIYRMTLNEDFAGITSKLYLEYLRSFKVIDENGDPMLCLFKENFKNLLVGMLSYKGNLIMVRFNQIIDRLLQTGIIDMWVKDLLTMSRLKVLKQHSYSTGSSYIMSMSHLQGAFYLLALGLILGVVALIWEITGRYRR